MLSFSKRSLSFTYLGIVLDEIESILLPWTQDNARFDEADLTLTLTRKQKSTQNCSRGPQFSHHADVLWPTVTPKAMIKMSLKYPSKHWMRLPWTRDNPLVDEAHAKKIKIFVE